MYEYFIRHGSVSNPHSIAISGDDMRTLWNQDKIAIHFPGPGPVDSESIDPADYTTYGEKWAIRTFNELNQLGGYILAYYRTHIDTVKIGIIESGSFDIFTTKWVTRPNRIAKIKTLNFKEKSIEKLTNQEIQSLWERRHRRATLCRWHSAKGDLKRLILKNLPKKS